MVPSHKVDTDAARYRMDPPISRFFGVASTDSLRRVLFAAKLRLRQQSSPKAMAHLYQCIDAARGKLDRAYTGNLR
jgi:hypothetical protein